MVSKATTDVVEDLEAKLGVAMERLKGKDRGSLLLSQALLKKMAESLCQSTPKDPHFDALSELVPSVHEDGNIVLWNDAHKFFIVVKRNSEMVVGFYGNCLSNWAGVSESTQTVAVLNSDVTPRFNSTEAIFKTCCFVMHKELKLCDDDACLRAMEATTLKDVKGSTKTLKFNSEAWDLVSRDIMLYCTGLRLKSEEIFKYMLGIYSLAGDYGVSPENVSFCECTELVSS